MSGVAVESHVLRAERRLVEAMTLRSRALQPRFAQATGMWKDAPHTIITRVYEGDAVGLMRIAMIAGAALRISSLLVCARPNRALPILAMELVSRGVSDGLTVVVDLVPVSRGERRNDDCRAIARSLRGIPPLPQGEPRATPDVDWCSPSALNVRAGAERAKDALAAANRYVDAWITMAGAAAPVPEAAEAVRARQEAFMSARRGDAATRSLLAAMFGRAWADEYLASVLYPAS